MISRASVIILILLISISASLAQQPENNKISPAPGPAPSVNLTSSKPVVKKKPIVKETCNKVSLRCQFKSLTACLPNYKTGSQGSYLLVVNDGERSVKVEIMILPANDTLRKVQIPSHQTEKVTFSANVRVGSSFLLNAGDGNCTIKMGALAPQTNFYQQFSSYDAYATPTNGAYLLLLFTIIVGGAWACCKLKKKDRHLDGVPYQELEMGNPAVPVCTNLDVEAAEGWDQDWDDDWDDDKAVKSPGGSHLNGKPANGLPSKSTDSNGRGNDWDD